VFVAQGRTVDIGRAVVSEGMTRDLLYVAMTRGRERNQAYVVTGPPDAADLSRAERDAYAEAATRRALELYQRGDLDGMRAVQPEAPEPEGMRERNTWESVVAAAMERDELAGTAIEAMREAQEFPVHMRHLYEIAEAGWWLDVVPQIDDMVRQRLRWDDYQRYLNDPERPAFLQELRRHETGGRPIADVLDSITARPLDGARSVAAVLHGRAGKEPAPARGDTVTWAERSPGTAPDYVRESFTELDRRQAELGEQLAAQPPQWGLEAWGVPPAEAGRLRDDWMQRAVTVQGYRELAGVTDPAVAIGPPPSRQAGMTEAFAASVRALELPDQAALVKAMGRGELEAQVREYARAEAVALVDVQAAIVSGDAARGRYLNQAQAARQAGNEELARQVEDLVQILAADRAQLQVADAARLEWEEATAAQAEAAGQARAELEARGPARRDERPEAQGAEARDVQADEPAAEVEAGREARAEAEAEREATPAELGTQAEPTPEAEAGAWPEAQADMGAEVDPEALTVMASIEADLTAIDCNLDRAQAGAEELAAQRERDQAERDRAVIDEPVIRAEAEAQAELEAEHAETDDKELEI
jgi:hypothetical protein